jgi:hypothetical protein
MPNESHADHLKRWDMALVAGAANAEEPGVDDLRIKLEGAAQGAKATIARRNYLKFQLQQSSRDLDVFMDTGKEAYSRLVFVVKGRYGPESEKMVEWGLQPRRPTQVSTERKVKRFLEKEKEKPPENGQSPTQAAHPQAESSNRE